MSVKFPIFSESLEESINHQRHRHVVFACVNIFWFHIHCDDSELSRCFLLILGSRRVYISFSFKSWVKLIFNKDCYIKHPKILVNHPKILVKITIFDKFQILFQEYFINFWSKHVPSNQLILVYFLSHLVYLENIFQFSLIHPNKYTIKMSFIIPTICAA